MNTVCPIHQTPWKTIPAGTSKSTGQPYPAFQVCQDSTCKQRPPKAAQPPQQVGSIPAPKKEPDWDKITRGKVRCQVVCAEVAKNGLFDLTPEKTVQIENLVNLIMDEESEDSQYSEQDWENSL